ncbi:pyocin knob domain-containing protein [Stutzerimonas kirkiae]|uniref:pyocin knob domain-containing protein n=1 Tax=Stutzerimonas kirkiae TaxID=2211392 RepID=UPI001F613681|nr:hypothetical protein [Stutzerimonas kirkiae]
MATLDEVAEWVEGIYQLETSDPVLGGPDGIDNLQAKQLARRTLWLKAAIEVLGLNKQPLDDTLTALAGLNTAANQMIYTTGADKFALTPLTAFMRTLLDDVDEATARATLGAAPLESPALTGTPTAPTPATGNSSTRLATTAFVQAAITALVNSSPAALDTLAELATALGNDANFATTMTNALAAKAPLASPALTGTPTAPTAAVAINNTQLATTAFVKAALANAAYLASATRGMAQGNSTQDPNLATAPVILTNHANCPKTTVYWHITTTFYAVISETANRAQIAVAYNGSTPEVWARSCFGGVWLAWVPLYNLASPTFTGVPTAPTAAAGTNSTQLATTAFVTAVQTLLDNAIALRAPLASPALTGTPTAPTAAQTVSSTQIATTAFVKAAIAALVDSSPGALDTLNELAAALGDDPNFATTMTNALAQKLSLSGGSITGQVIAATRQAGIYGTYDASRINHVWSIGSAYKIAADGSDFGNLYGLAYKYVNNTTGGTMAGGHQLVLCSDGTPCAAIGFAGNFWTSGAYYGSGAGLVNIPQAGVAGLVAALAAKAALASPAFTGTPTVPTAATATNNTQIANTAWVKARIAELPESPKNTWGIVGTSAWWKCGDTGLIRQFGRVKEAAGATDYRSFPIAFPNACLSLNATRTTDWNRYNDGTCSLVISNSQFAVLSGAYSGDDIFWEAIGY